MSKKHISEGILDKVIDKIFGQIAKGTQGAVVKKMKKDNPEMAKAIDQIAVQRKNLEKAMIKKYGSYKDYEKAVLGKYGIK
jgi:hypothetical protein